MVTVEELLEVLHTAFPDLANKDDINENSELYADVGLKSIEMLYMAMVLEEKYSVQFSSSDFENLKTIGDVIAKISSKE